MPRDPVLGPTVLPSTYGRILGHLPLPAVMELPGPSFQTGDQQSVIWRKFGLKINMYHLYAHLIQKVKCVRNGIHIACLITSAKIVSHLCIIELLSV